MAQPFILGDSHARWLIETKDLGVHEHDGWVILGVGGASAHNLVSDVSSTGARLAIMDCLDSRHVQKDIYLLFGEVDCSHHIEDADDLANTAFRYRMFVTELYERSDIGSISICSVYPRTSSFRMDRREAPQIQRTIEAWNATMQPTVDLHSPLLGPNGFMIPEMSRDPEDPGERHLSKIGNSVVWSVLRAHHSASVF